MGAREKRLLIVMPAHNEAAHIRTCLDSMVRQTRKPDLLQVVDDHSTDGTAAVVREYAATHPWIRLSAHTSSPDRQPGPKVVAAFLAGLPENWGDFDYIGKFDADIELPREYFQTVLDAFASRPSLGICSGLLHIERAGRWIYEPIAEKSHVRGPVKCYSRVCYEAIGGLRTFIGWDVADVMLARYRGYETATLPDLAVKHLRPTGSGYSRRNARLQGRALYNLRYGWLLGGIASVKMALTRRAPLLPWQALLAYARAWIGQKPRMLTREEGRFVRNWRWKGVQSRLLKGFGNR